MSEKVLGVPVEYFKCFGTNNGIRYEITVYESELVSVHLASESVDLKALKEWCEKNNDYFFKPHHNELIKWAEKEAKKKNE